jgi:tetratricopeptide (TPR) repeat protein
MPITAISPEKIKEKSYLLYKIQQKHSRWNTAKSALLIGAGCSYPILPLGSGLIRICQQLCFIRHADPVAAAQLIGDFLKNGDMASLGQAVMNAGEDTFNAYVNDREKILQQKLLREKGSELNKLPENASWEEYEEAILADARYGYWMDEYTASPKERQQLIESLIENKNPGGAYIVLAYLIEKGFFSNILTSNFDDFVNDSLLYYTGTKPRFYADDELSQYISIYSAKPNIIKLHGDYRYANIKNTNDETNKLSRRLEGKLRELLTELDIIILGYNGADYSIMNVLQQVKSPDCELLWCGLDENNVHWRVAQLINNTENSYFIRIKGFDDLMGDFYLEFLKTPPDNLVEKAKKRQEEIGEYVKQFSRELKDKAETPEEKERLEKQEEIWALWNKAFEKNDLGLQITLMTNIITLDKNSVLGYQMRGNAYYELSKYEEALQDYNSVIELKNDDPEHFNDRGIAYYKLKKYDKAVEDYNRAIELDNHHETVYNNRGALYIDLKQYDKALPDLNRATELEKNDPNPYKHRGNCYYELKNYKMALQNLNKAIELNPKYKDAYEIRAKVYTALEEEDKARSDYEMAKKLAEAEVNHQPSLS